MGVVRVKCPVCERDITLDFTVQGGRYKEPAMIEWLDFCPCYTSRFVDQGAYTMHVHELAEEAWLRCEDEDVD